MINWLIDWIIARAKRTPYFHLHHADGSLYMERYWLLKTRWFAVKLHGIHTPDMDHAMHDHPWSFISIVLRGAYIERVPVQQNKIDFHATGPTKIETDEAFCENYRGPGSIAFRGFWCRHRITTVTDGDLSPVWTLFITGFKHQSWGFFTPEGKIWWWVYESAHNKFNMDLTQEHHDAAHD